MDSSLDLDKFGNDVSNALQEFKNLHSAHEENKKGQKELSEFVALLQEEVKLARDAARTADFKKSRSQAYVSQQQEVILRLLSVKEENESLKQKIRQMEITLSDIQNNSMAEHVKKDAQIQEIKQEYLKEFMKVEEAANGQVNKIKAELSSTLEELRATISKDQETIEKQENVISVLQSEIEDLKERASINVDIYQKKLAEQERKYQAELDTWKMAELNRTNFDKQTRNTSVAAQHCPGSGSNVYQQKQIPEYSHGLVTQNTGNNQLNSYPSLTNLYPTPQPFYKNQPLISRSRNVSRILPNNIRPLTSQINRNVQNKEFLSANELYMQKEASKDDSEENAMFVKTTTVTAPKRRKLFNSNESFL